MPQPDRLEAAARAALKAAKANKGGPLWTGPNGEGPNGGVTQGLLARFLSCRERFRLRYIEGWKHADKFEPRIEFGSMWHECEQRYAQGGIWAITLRQYTKKLYDRYPFDRDAITHWHGLCEALFPEYVKYWAEHPDVKDRKPLLQEEIFDVRYELPSGRYVRLKGKWDSVDLIKGQLWLQENKTKSQIHPEQLERQVRYDLQTMLYLTAMSESMHPDLYAPGEYGKKYPVAGIRYNVVRRPAHKSVGSAMKKFKEDMEDNRAGEWFARWNVHVSQADILRFRKESLDPILEQLCAWWSEITGGPGWVPPMHYRTPYFYNPLAEGGFGDVDAMLNDGSTAGLKKATVVFPELEITT